MVSHGNKELISAGNYAHREQATESWAEAFDLVYIKYHRQQFKKGIFIDLPLIAQSHSVL